MENICVFYQYNGYLSSLKSQDLLTFFQNSVISKTSGVFFINTMDIGSFQNLEKLGFDI